MSAARRFHLGWFTNAHPHGWSGRGPVPWSGGNWRPEHWQRGSGLVELAQAIERAGFDYLLLEDHVVVADTYRDTTEFDLGSAARGARLDPLPVIVHLAAHTSRLGLIATVTTGFSHPFPLARQLATIDHLSGGRAGWNVVTGGEETAARAHGVEGTLPSHDERYDRADEFLDAASQLWEAWQQDAVVTDVERGVYADHARVRRFAFDGEYYRTRGPLNVARSPQGRPVLSQAGTSPRGRRFAARHADVVIGPTYGEEPIATMRAFRDEVRSLASEAGRDPHAVKVLFPILPVLADTDEIARGLARREVEVTDSVLDRVLSGLSADNNLDFGRFDPDRPLPRITSQGHLGSLAAFLASGQEQLTLRELVARRLSGSALDRSLVGTPASVADRLEEVAAQVGGDGFLIHGFTFTRRYIAEITDGLVPELQRRGLVREHYAHERFRDNLLEF